MVFGTTISLIVSMKYTGQGTESEECFHLCFRLAHYHYLIFPHLPNVFLPSPSSTSFIFFTQSLSKNSCNKKANFDSSYNNLFFLYFLTPSIILP